MEEIASQEADGKDHQTDYTAESASGVDRTGFVKSDHLDSHGADICL